MNLSKEQVEQLAALSRLKLTEKETLRYQKELNLILDHVGRLQKFIAAKKVEVKESALTRSETLRDDLARPPLTLKERAHFLAAARKTDRGYVVVPRVLKEKR